MVVVLEMLCVRNTSIVVVVIVEFLASEEF